jgi:hypothetical protein
MVLGGVLMPAVGCKTFHPFSRMEEQQQTKTRAESPLLAPPGAPDKHHLRIHPYVFLSDFELSEDQPLFQDLKQLRTQVYRDLQLPPGQSLIQVYLFETKERYESFMNVLYPNQPQRRAFFMAIERALGAADDLVIYTYWSDRIQQDLRHELTHALLHSVLKDVPLWLDEGLAEYFEVPGEKHGVNEAHLSQMLRSPTGNPRPNLARLEQLKDISQMTPAEYQEAWLWVHLMLNGKPEGRTVLLRYLHELRTNPNPPPLAPRLQQVYPELEEAYYSHLGKLGAG